MHAEIGRPAPACGRPQGARGGQGKYKIRARCRSREKYGGYAPYRTATAPQRQLGGEHTPAAAEKGAAVVVVR